MKETVTTTSISQGIQSLSPMPVTSHVGCAGLLRDYGVTWPMGPFGCHHWTDIHLHVPSTSVPPMALLSSPQCKPLPKLSPHSGSQCTWGTACGSGVIENVGMRTIGLWNFWPPLLRVMSVQVSYHRLCVPRRLPQSQGFFEALE